MTSDPHTLDEYAETLRELETDGRAVAVHVLACKLHGVPAATKMRQATTLALDELVAQGRAEQSYPGRYRATRAPAGRGVISGVPVYINGTKIEESAVTGTITVIVSENEAPKLNEPGFAGAVAGLTLPCEPADPTVARLEVTEDWCPFDVHGGDDDDSSARGEKQAFRSALAAPSEGHPLAGMFRSINAVASAMLGGTPATPAPPAVTETKPARRVVSRAGALVELHEAPGSKLRNYEIEERLGNAVVGEWCPFDGVWCDWLREAPKEVVLHQASLLRLDIDDPEVDDETRGRCKAALAHVEGELEKRHGGPSAQPDPFVARVNRAAGSVVDTMFGVSEYPDAIIAEAEVFAKRAAKALEMAREQLERAEAAEKAAAEAHCTAAGATLAAMQRVERLARIAGATE